MANKRKCLCCGKIYEYCPNCEKRNNEPWMVTFDCQLCKELFNIVSLYNVKRISKKAVQGFVKDKGIKDFSVYEEPIRKVLEETTENAKAVTVEKAIPEKKEIVTDPVKEQTVAVTIPKEPETVNSNSPLPHRKRKRRYGY